MSTLHVYNSLSRRKEKFEPLNPPFVGMYVCGPTVYGEPHLGHARPAITFDVVFRYLKFLGYKVRYVRNITDVGHLVNDADAGEDKIAKKARVEKLEPMEVVQFYTNKYHEAMQLLNVLPPSIEPFASGHIIEQIKMIEEILKAGYAYVSDGSVYFDVVKYNKDKHNYGKLSGRVIEELTESERTLEGQEEKRNKVDFALWKKAAPEHIMRWESPWSVGFPGWHLECSVMSIKYLGIPFDIHGGGMDLLFPHHECEIAQSVAGTGIEPVKYWLHNNMITINGQKMGKSLGNAVNLEQFFSGNHPLLEKGYSPMTIRFFMLQSHYRSTLDFSNDALKAAEKGFRKLLNTLGNLEKMEYPPSAGSLNESLEKEIIALCEQCKEHMDDDFNTAMTLAALFELAAKINAFHDKLVPLNSISKAAFDKMKQTFRTYIIDILGLKDEQSDNHHLTEGLMQLIIDIRKKVREKKDYATSDLIRDELGKLHIQLLDGREGTTWTIKTD
ncbi:MAG TPA: cysteine--tRNA ligase [Chitinophagales bacterium]|nr:cysteine--tRNA ligase [Chitinophagales bacterium]